MSTKEGPSKERYALHCLIETTCAAIASKPLIDVMTKYAKEYREALASFDPSAQVVRWEWRQRKKSGSNWIELTEQEYMAFNKRPNRRHEVRALCVAPPEQSK